MKIIDLLNKIANGEETPKKFKFANQIFIKEGLRYIDEDGDDIFESIFNDFSNINDEIEIIEEDKPIEKLEKIPTIAYRFGKGITYCNFKNEQNINVLYLKNKINEIIDVVNELKERE